MQRGFSSFALTAVLCVGVLVVAIIYTFMPQVAHMPTPPVAVEDTAEPLDPGMVITDPRSTATSSVTGLSPLGDAVINRVISAFSAAQDKNQSTLTTDATSTATEIARTLRPVVQAHTYSALELKTTSDVSLKRILAYRSDLRDSLAPLLSIPEPEYATFGRYIQSHDASNLVVLEHDATIYRTAASSTLHVVVPSDAVQYHLGILNAMEGFAAKLSALASHASDPFASAALLRSYNDGEQDMLMSFNKLAQYYRAKAGVATTTTSS